MWGMQKAGIDLPSTSNFVLDRLQGSPQQFLMLHLSHPAPPPLQNACRVTLRRRLTVLVHKSIQFPLIRDTSVSGTLKDSVITSGQGLQVRAARRETVGFQLQPWVGGAMALFRATGRLSSLPLALRKVTRGARCTQVGTPAYHSWPGTAAGRSCCRAVSAVGRRLHTCPRSSLSYRWRENL